MSMDLKELANQVDKALKEALKEETPKTIVKWLHHRREKAFELKFNTEKDFLCWLIANENTEVTDNYGRRWKYANHKFYFQDADEREYKEGIKCTHLYKTQLQFVY